MASKKVIPLLINGRRIVSSDVAKHIPVVGSPSKSSDPVHYAQGATREQAIEAAKAAKAAFSSWKNSSLMDRREILLNAASILTKRREEGIELSVLESMPEV